MKLRRGFLKEAEEYALEFREELGLEKNSALEARVLAEHLGIPVYRVSDLPDLPPHLAARVMQQGSNCFFGAVIPDGTFRAIVHNNFVSLKRQSADIMHELSHIVLGHPVHPPTNLDGTRAYNSVLESEAKELSYTLMMPKCIALLIVESGMSLQVASQQYQTSVAAIEYRIRKTDARGWAENRKRKYS